MSDPRAVKYVAEIRRVREVSLLGSADLAFWQNKLAPQGLAPVDRDGCAWLAVGGTAARYMGLPFREVTVAVLVRRPDRPDRDAFYLAAAGNSSRLLACCERVLFSTPYRHADVRVEAGANAFIRLRAGAGALAAAVAPGRDFGPARDDGWEGPIYLPPVGRESGPGPVFFARLGGRTHSFPFDPAGDTLTLDPAPGCEPLAWLAGSGFRGREWTVRPDATHARSRTFRRDRAPAP